MFRQIHVRLEPCPTEWLIGSAEDRKQADRIPSGNWGKIRPYTLTGRNLDEGPTAASLSESASSIRIVDSLQLSSSPSRYPCGLYRRSQLRSSDHWRFADRGHCFCGVTLCAMKHGPTNPVCPLSAGRGKEKQILFEDDNQKSKSYSARTGGSSRLGV